jgi:periplasmic divalent cation tolerance protein
MVTAPNLKTARLLAREALQDRLVACANLIPRLESHYWWQGKLEKSAEVLVVMKTTRERLQGLEQKVLGLHPYDTPEFLVLPVDGGSRRYLDWIGASVSGKAA